MKSNLNLALLLIMTSGLVWGQKSKEYKRINSIAYYDSSEISNDSYMQEMCVLDLYYPEYLENFPTVVWFHGGGLTSGKREIPEYLKNKGVAVIGVGYRLSPKVKSVECIEDAAAATAWAFENIENYGGDSSKIFVSGMSAGGYLTYMIGLDKTYLEKHAIDANNIAALIPFSGHAISHFTVRKENGISETQPIIDAMAPLFHVRADAPPLTIITGDRELELLGRYEENAYMMRMLKVSGHKNVKLYELDGSNHGQMMYPALPILLREVESLSK